MTTCSGAPSARAAAIAGGERGLGLGRAVVGDADPLDALRRGACGSRTERRRPRTALRQSRRLAGAARAGRGRDARCASSRRRPARRDSTRPALAAPGRASGSRSRRSWMRSASTPARRPLIRRMVGVRVLARRRAGRRRAGDDGGDDEVGGGRRRERRARRRSASSERARRIDADQDCGHGWLLHPGDGASFGPRQAPSNRVDPLIRSVVFRSAAARVARGCGDSPHGAKVQACPVYSSPIGSKHGATAEIADVPRRDPPRLRPRRRLRRSRRRRQPRRLLRRDPRQRRLHAPLASRGAPLPAPLRRRAGAAAAVGLQLRSGR